MKQLKLFACLALLLLGACTGKKSSPDLANMEQNDSLQRIIAQRDSEINDMMSTLNEIQEGLSAINQAENRLSIAREGEGANKTAQIKENIKFIANTMARNRELMKRLQQQLRESRFNGDELRKTISNLTQQLDDKAQELQRLKAIPTPRVDHSLKPTRRLICGFSSRSFLAPAVALWALDETLTIATISAFLTFLISSRKPCKRLLPFSVFSP